NRRGGHCREADAAPGCTITVCSETSVGPGQGQRRSSGSVDTPYHSNKAHHSLASWTGPGHGALVVDAGPPHSWAQSSSGARARRASVLCGPRPCRFTASSGAGPGHDGVRSGSVGTTLQFSPACSISSPYQAGAARKRVCPGKADSRARNAGTPVTKSPRPSERAASNTGASTIPPSSPTTNPSAPPRNTAPWHGTPGDQHTKTFSDVRSW